MKIHVQEEKNMANFLPGNQELVQVLCKLMLTDISNQNDIYIPLDTLKILI